MEKIIINIDGGSRGNPGLSACSCVFSNSQGVVIKKFSAFLNVGTNNYAEYHGLILALKKAKSFFGKEKIKNLDFEIRSDSELLVSQLNRRYKVLDSQIQRSFFEAWNLMVDFKNFNLVLIKREENILADKLVNEILDQNQNSHSLF